LEDEEKRAEFDIHEYAAQVIRSAQFEVVRRKSDLSEVRSTAGISKLKTPLMSICLPVTYIDSVCLFCETITTSLLKTTKSSSMVKFEVVTRASTQFDVCRMFLASLSLANSGNVEIDEHSTIEDFQFILLSSDVNRPMETYRAPSLIQTEE
jgi:hypothetical protein